MDAKLDLTYFYQVKAKFSAEQGTIVFIDAHSKNPDELTAQIFTDNTFSDYRKIIENHCDNAKPYFVINRLDGIYTFFFSCEEFKRKEDYMTGKFLSFKRGPFEKLELDLDKVRSDLIHLGKLLSRDSEAA